MSLKEEIKTLTGNRRKYFLLCIADLDTRTALNICGVTRGTYNSWIKNPEFVEIHRRKNEFSIEYRQEAIQLLRRDNQLEAVLLEGRIIAKLKTELDTGEYALAKSHLAREVYSKLIADIDIAPKTQAISFTQRLEQIFNTTPEQIVEGEVIHGSFNEADIIEEKQLEESCSLPQGEQALIADEEEI